MSIIIYDRIRRRVSEVKKNATEAAGVALCHLTGIHCPTSPVVDVERFTEPLT